MDEVLLSAFEDVLGDGLSKEQRMQACLPVRVGGCGLRIPSLVRPAARVSALLTFMDRGVAPSAYQEGLGTFRHGEG